MNIPAAQLKEKNFAFNIFCRAGAVSKTGTVHRPTTTTALSNHRVCHETRIRDPRRGSPTTRSAPRRPVRAYRGAYRSHPQRAIYVCPPAVQSRPLRQAIEHHTERTRIHRTVNADPGRGKLHLD